MGHDIKTIADLICLWSSTEVGRKRGANISLSEDLGVPAATVRSMRHRNSIQKKYWSRLLAAARRHAAEHSASPAFAFVDAELLVELCEVQEPHVADSPDLRERHRRMVVVIAA